jgi:amino acid transporter
MWIAFLIVIFLIFLVFGLFVLLPIFIKFLNRKDKRLKFLLLIPTIYFVYSIYSAIYPPDSFYKQDFKEVTGIDFPERGEIIYKTASFPDHFGDYGSVSVIKVDKEFYSNLDKQLTIKGLRKTAERTGSPELDNALKEIKGKKIESEFSLEQGGGVYYYVAFLSDKETLIVCRQSW